MGKVWRVSILVTVVLILAVSSALAAEFSLGAKYLYGTYLMRAYEEERYGSTFPLYALDGSLALGSGLKLSVEAIYGNSGYIEEDLAGYYKYNDSYSPYVFGSVKANMSWPFSDNLALVVGYTAFRGTLDWDNDDEDHDWYYAGGGGFKLGFETGFDLSDRLSASLKYAFLPRVYVNEYYAGGYDYDYEWMGTGHEYDLSAAYAFSDHWTLEAGYKGDLYQGITGCCGEGADVSIGACYGGVKFTF